MAFTSIPAGAVDAGSPVNKNLMDLIRTDLDDLDSRIGAVTGSSNYIPAADSLIDRNASRRAGVSMHEVDNTVSELFTGTEVPQTDAFLLEDYTSGGSTMKLAINPVFISDADMNFNSASGWTVRNDGANLSASTTQKKIGTHALYFEKAGAGTFASISYDMAKSISENLNAFFWIHMNSVTNLTHMRVRVHSTTGTNYSDFDVTNDVAGNSFATGFNLIKVDLSNTPTSSTGTGWTTDQVVSRVEIGVVASSGAQVYQMYVDGVCFGDSRSGGSWIAKGEEVTIYNTSTKNDIIIANASTLGQGLVTLAASVANNYTAGTATTINRSTLTYDTDEQLGNFTNTLSGQIADSQEFRMRRNLDVALVGTTLGAYTVLKTDLFLRVKTIASGTSLTLYSSKDLSGEFLNGDAIVHFKKKKSGAKTNFEMTATAPTLSAGSSWATGVLTLTLTSTAGISVGDYISIANLVQAYASLVDEGDDESFAAMTLADIDVLASTDGGIQGILHSYAVGNAVSTSEEETDLGPGAINLTVTAGNLTAVAGKVRGTALGGFGTGYLQDARVVTDHANTHLGGIWRSTWTAGGWFYIANASRTDSMYFFGGFEGGFGWTIRTEGGATQKLRVGSGTSDSATWAEPSLDNWHHYVVTHSWSGSASTWNVYIDGVNVLNNATFGDVSNVRQSVSKSGWFTVGANGTGGNNLGAGSKADDIFLMDSIISQRDIAFIYNNGIGRPITINENNLVYFWSSAALSGKELSMKAKINLEVGATTTAGFKHLGMTRT